MNIDAKVEALRATTAGALFTVWGFSLNEWVAIATLVYMVLQIVLIIKKLRAERVED